MQINVQIKQYRKAAGLTQEQVANALGVSTPAVNKWEKGTTFPDITLLPALARLLKIDLDTLFSFRETLTDVEIEAFSRELALLSQENLDKAFAMAVTKIQEYPGSDSLLLTTANILNAGLLLSPVEAEKKQRYEELVTRWIEQAAESGDNEIKDAAVSVLLGKAMEAGDYDRAAVLLEQLPNRQFDKTPYEANILIQQEKPEQAAILLASKLLQTLSGVQTYCMKLMELELDCGHREKAHQIAEKMEKLVSLFGLWQYGAVVPRLQLALHEKDEQRSVAAIREMLQAAERPWILSDSPLFYRIAHDTVQSVGKSFLPALISDLKTGEEFTFLRSNPAFQALVSELDADAQSDNHR